MSLPWWAWVAVAIVGWSVLIFVMLVVLALIGTRARKVSASKKRIDAGTDVISNDDLARHAIEQRARIMGETVGPDREVTPIWRLHYAHEQGADLRAMGPMRVCVCGCDLWRALVTWDEDGDVDFWFLDVVCAGCGALAKAITPLDMLHDDDEDELSS
jgi:hypothetical protein